MLNIAVVDWFTKNRGNIFYPDESDKKLDELIEKLIKGFKGDNLEQIADNIYEILKQSDFYNKICSDTVLPICSLFYHSKITSGIAVCLALQKATLSDLKSKCLKQYEISENISAEYSDGDFIALIRLAALLHDIGKPRSYTAQKKELPFKEYLSQTEEIINHILQTASFDILSKYELNKILPKLATKNPTLDSKTILGDIIEDSDSIASAADRIYELKIRSENNSLYVESGDKIFPHEINFNFVDSHSIDGLNTEIIGYKGKIPLSQKTNTKDNTQIYFKDSVVDGGVIQDSGAWGQISGDIGILALDIMRIQEYVTEADILPMLRGGSSIVEESLEKTFNIISNEICPEAVLFKGGGNLLAFVPFNTELQQNIKRRIKEVIRNTSKGGLGGALITKNVQIKDLAEFPEVLKKLQDEIEREKNYSRNLDIIKPKDRNDICPFCFKRKVIPNKEICSVCSEKKNSGLYEKYENENKYLNTNLLNKHGLYRPIELQDIGDSIAVIAIDGNMMGRIFMQTMTPNEYNYKSETFDRTFKKEVRDTIENFINNNEMRYLIEHRKFMGIDPLYVGGDDILLIINAKGAIKFCEMLIKNISERFKYSKKFSNGMTFENPIVTISCGIAIADAKFPIYFLLDTARKMESIAKKEFRKKTKTDNLNLIQVPVGTMAFTAVSGAMPSEDNISFVLPDDDKDLGILNNLISKSLNEQNRSKISSLITCGKTEQERLNFVKSIYSSGSRKQMTPSEWLDDCEWMVKVMGNERLLRSAKMIIPQFWHIAEET